MKISKIRTILYRTAKYLGDFDSIGKKELEREWQIVSQER